MNFTLADALQISALIPCVFLACYIIAATKYKKFAIIPVFYFIAIASGIFFRLMPAIGWGTQDYPQISFVLMLADSMIAALSFLLIVQMCFNQVPSLSYWSILAVPLVATSPFIFAVVQNVLACTSDIDVCFPSMYALHLNMALVSSVIMLLLIVLFARRSVEIEGDVKLRQHKYWLIMSLIIYNVVLILIEIGFVAESINSTRYAFAKAMVEIAFIYMVITSIFRVFSDHFELQPANITLSRDPLTAYEESVGVRAEKMLNTDKVYREPGFNRANFAKLLSVREHVLSRIVNIYFNKSFSELANEYRIAEAKELLKNKDLSITAISYDVGYSSITSFNRVFKEVTTISPSQFRDSITDKGNNV